MLGGSGPDTFRRPAAPKSLNADAVEPSLSYSEKPWPTVVRVRYKMGAMISRVECRNFRLFRDVSVQTGAFQLLVGPNGSGKSSFLDVIALLGDLLRVGLPSALLGDSRAGVRSRVSDPLQLCFQQRGAGFDLAVELTLPPTLSAGPHDRIRYSVKVAVDAGKGKETVIEDERLVLLPREKSQGVVRLLDSRAAVAGRPVLQKTSSGRADKYFAETSDWQESFRLPSRRLALTNLPEDEERFPAANWVRRTLLEGMDRIELDAEALRRPSPPGLSTRLLPDGGNLPWLIASARQQRPEVFARFVAHVRTALPELSDITTVERAEDRHCYLALEYTGGSRVPSWVLSTGTLRLIALTFLGYFPVPGGVYLLEEPENGIHPRAIETAYQALSTMDGAQLLCTSHSPVLLNLARPEDILCFRKTEDGSAEVIPGAEHPALASLRGNADLGTLFAAGVME